MQEGAEQGLPELPSARGSLCGPGQTIHLSAVRQEFHAQVSYIGKKLQFLELNTFCTQRFLMAIHRLDFFL
jgi:hypothetical protein